MCEQCNESRRDFLKGLAIGGVALGLAFIQEVGFGLKTKLKFSTLAPSREPGGQDRLDPHDGQG